ncbi:MAG: helix-turn-helix domain-containing protein [Lachnospiraceae bacterium]|nr:helix-turn-helix domain-containing protein [Lachnospiraceae bacterium]
MKKILKNSVIRFWCSSLLVLCFAVILISVGFQQAFLIVENHLKSMYVNMLQRTVDSFENDLTDIESISLQIANDTAILNMAAKEKGQDDYIVTAIEAVDRYALYVSYQSIDLLNNKQMYLYYPNTDLVLFQGSYYKTDIFRAYVEDEWGEPWEEWLTRMQETALTYPDYQKTADGFEYVFPFSGKLFGDREGTIVFRVSGSAIASKLKFTAADSNTEAYPVAILDNTGELIWCSGEGEFFSALTLEELDSGYLEKNDISVMIAQSDSRGWYYVLLVPMEEVLSEFMALRNMVILLVAAALLGGTILSFVVSHRNGKPINEVIEALALGADDAQEYSYRNLGTAVSEVVRRHASMLREAEQNKTSLQKIFFSDLLKAGFGNEEQLKAAAQKAGLEIENQVYQVALVCLFAENDFASADEQTLNDAGVLLEIVRNRLHEAADGMVWFYRKNYNTMAMIFSVDHLETDVPQLVHETREWLLRECQVEPAWGIGGTCHDLLLIWRSLEEAELALQLSSRKEPVSMYRTELIDSNDFYFPAVAQERLEECLKSGQWREAREVLEVLETENCSLRNLSRSQFIRLCRMFADLLNGVWKNEGFDEVILNLNELLVEPQIRKEEYFRRLKTFCRKICNDAATQKQEQRGRTVDEIREYIEMHYREPDMGLSRVGSEFRMSESYLSTIFKEQAGVNFGEYLEKKRIEEACRMLKDSDATINEVAERVGYNNVRTFRRAFVRVKGVSPREIRQEG